MVLVVVLSIVGLIAFLFGLSFLLESKKLRNAELTRENKQIRAVLTKVREAAYAQSEFESVLSSQIRSIINEAEV